MSYNKNRSIVIRNAIINSLFILWCLVWRTGLGLTFFIIYASLGYIYSWPFYLPISIILGFAPWGWKVQEERKMSKLENKIGDGFIYARAESNIEINYRGVIFLKSVFGLFGSGFWGIILGWKAILGMVVQLLDNIRTVIKYI
ncbi:hypothetical protein H1Q63_03695 [Desmonostoc muscorum CCALA 125]|nr:hypothetical protein [Desmonostoc muscorum CCALA 125]